MMTTPPGIGGNHLLNDCTSCGLTNSFIFNVRHRGMYRRFCTPCVLKNHTGSFCPICFDVFDDNKPLPSHLRVICFNCSSISHHSCVNPSSSSRYRCPPCSDSNFSFFDLDHKRFKTNHGLPTLLPQPQHQPLARKSINEYLAKQLLAAAKIAVSSMNKAAAAATLEAEKRVKEAAVTRKRAKDALELLAQLVAKEKSESKSMIGGVQKTSSNNHVHYGSPCLAHNWAQNQLPVKNGSVPPPQSNAAATTPENLMKESNGLHSSSVSRHQ